MRDNPTQENPMLNVRGLTVTVQKEPSRHILNDINFDVHGGQILSVLGPSGAGKTTLLRCLALLHTETTGTIRVNGAPVNSLEAGKIGIVFQNFNLFPHLSVLDNMVLAPKCHKKDTLPALIEHAHSLLAQFGIADHAHAYPHSLSGGQKQRVAIARALMMDPPILLFDEPTSALDPELVHDVATIIKTLRKPDRVIIVVTHEIRLAKHVADQILFLDKGIVLDNVPKEVFFGKDERTISPRAHTFLSNLG